MFAFSTCWNSDRHTDGEAMLDEIRELGFHHVELSHGIRVSLIEGIERARKKDPGLVITSLHNFCPLPVGVFRSNPNVYLLSSDRESERQKAIRQTLHTLDFAANWGARVVVLHLGAVRMGDYTKDLIRLIRDGKRESPKYARVLEKAMAKRRSKGGKAFGRVMRSLEVLIPEAANRQIQLGLESRYRLEEIPTGEEFDEIFRAFDSPWIGYWHDAGHCQTWHNLGIIDHVAWLKHFESRLIGGHMHDTKYPDHDHQLPGDGDVPFAGLSGLRKRGILKVFEFEPGMPAEALKARLPGFMKSFEVEA